MVTFMCKLLYLRWGASGPSDKILHHQRESGYPWLNNLTRKAFGWAPSPQEKLSRRAPHHDGINLSLVKIYSQEGHQARGYPHTGLLFTYVHVNSGPKGPS